MAYWLDDGFDTWPETIRAGKAATGLYVCCGAWIARNISNGTITDPVIPAEIATMYGTPEWVAKLVAVGLWKVEGTGYQDVKYFQMGNPTAELVRKRRAAAARRQALTRDPALREAVRARDKDRCRYCSAAVAWSDRKGSKGGTYDHVDPYGPNTFENLVVCCRGCNSSKRDRTPDEAGMALRPAPSNPGTTQIVSRSDLGGNLDSSRPPALPPSKEGRGARASTRPTPSPQDLKNKKTQDASHDASNPDWRNLPAFGAPRDPADAERARTRAAETKTALNATLNPPPPAETPPIDAGPGPEDRVWIATKRRGIQAHQPADNNLTTCRRSMRTGQVLLTAFLDQPTWCPRCWPNTAAA